MENGMKTLPEKIRRLAVTVALIGLAVGSLSHADEGSPTLIDELKKELLGIQNNISNAKMKLRNPMSGVSATGSIDKGSKRPPTPAEACCSVNLESIRKHTENLNRTFEQLYLYYSDRNQAAALIEVDQVRGQLGIISRGTAVFKMAGSEGQAEQALFGLIRPFNELRAGIGRLEACCPVEPAATAESGTE